MTHLVTYLEAHLEAGPGRTRRSTSTATRANEALGGSFSSPAAFRRRSEPRAKNAQKKHDARPFAGRRRRASFLSHSGLFAAVAGVARALGANPWRILPALLETHLRLVRETLAGAGTPRRRRRASLRVFSHKKG